MTRLDGTQDNIDSAMRRMSKIDLSEKGLRNAIEYDRKSTSKSPEYMRRMHNAHTEIIKEYAFRHDISMGSKTKERKARLVRRERDE